MAVDPIALAALVQQQDDDTDFSAALGTQKAEMDAQVSQLMERIMGGRRKPEAKIPEELQPLIAKLTSHPLAVKLVPIVDILLANPLMIEWATRTVTTKLTAVQQAIDQALQ